MEKIEREKIASNVALYIKLNGYTDRTFAQVTHLSQTTLQAIITGKITKPARLKKQLDKITLQLGLASDYFASEPEAIAATPIHYHDETKLHLGDEKLSALSLLLKIGEIHYK